MNVQPALNLQAGLLAAVQRRRRVWQKIVSVLACIVVFCTTYALILPAITIDRRRSAEEPGMILDPVAVVEEQSAAPEPIAEAPVQEPEAPAFDKSGICDMMCAGTEPGIPGDTVPKMQYTAGFQNRRFHCYEK